MSGVQIPLLYLLPILTHTCCRSKLRTYDVRELIVVDTILQSTCLICAPQHLQSVVNSLNLLLEGERRREGEKERRREGQKQRSREAEK